MKQLNFIRVGISMLLLFASYFPTNAQSPISFTQAMDSLLAPLDKGPITTGILYDRVKPMANIELFNLSSSDPFIAENSYFGQAYFELYYAAYNNTGWIQPEHLRAYAEGESLQGKYTIGVLDYQFNIIDSNAVSNGQLSFNNGQFHNVAGAASPYWQKRIQVASILADEVPSGQFSLYYNPDFVKTNQSLSISSIQLNFGSIGIYTLSPANPIVQLTFSGSGVKQYTVTTFYSNGTSFSHNAEVQIGTNTEPYANRTEGVEASLPDATFWISGKYSYKGFGEAQPAYGKAKVSIWWKRDANNMPIPGLKKPVIIVDGFDPNGGRKDTSIYDLFRYYDQSYDPYNFADELRSFGKDFDIVVMDMPGYTKDFPSTINDPASTLSYPRALFDAVAPENLKGVIFGGGDFQQRNAYVLEALIDYCNQQVQNNGSNEQLVVIGPSMGGQITRYALRDMELRGQNHNCRLWVSFDSHHQGSYAPMGIQYSLEQLAKNSNEAAFFKNIFLDCPEAKQSLMHHYSTNSETVQAASGYYSDYYNEVNNPAFGFPQAAGLRRIAMLSGSDLGVPQTFGTACQLATKVEAKYRPRKILAILSFSPLAAILSPLQTQNTYLAPATGQCTVFKLSADIGQDISKKVYAPTWSSTSLDMLQGGHFPSFKIYRDAVNGKRPQKWYKNLVKLYADDYVGSQVQQLTYSTLAVGLGALPDPTRKWDDNFRKDKFNQPIDVTCPETKESPFDMYWAPDINTRHDSLLLGHVVRLRKEVIEKQPWPRTLIQRIATITDDASILCPGSTATFTVTAPFGGMSYIWAPSHPFLTIISGQGTPSVVVRNDGTVNDRASATVSCQGTSQCYTFNSTSESFIAGSLNASDYTMTGNSSTQQPMYWCPNQTYHFSISGNAASNYQWTIPTGWTINYQSNYLCVIKAPSSTSPPTGNVTVTFTEPCGTTVTKSFFTAYSPSACSSSDPRFTYSPNPAPSFLTVSVAQPYIGTTLIRRIKINRTSTGVTYFDQTYGSGVTSAYITTQSFPSGTYSLQIYDGSAWANYQFVR